MSEWNQKVSMYFLQVEGVIRWRVIFEVGDTRYEGDPSGCFGSGERWKPARRRRGRTCRRKGAWPVIVIIQTSVRWYFNITTSKTVIFWHHDVLVNGEENG